MRLWRAGRCRRSVAEYVWDVNRSLPVILDGTNTYVYGLDLIAAIDGAGVETYFTYDGLGSTADLTAAAAAVTDTYSGLSGPSTVH